jgi:YidC/Oxa1 family membrane protein insertase
MKKNWILFLLVCGAAYAWMIYGQIKKEQVYKEALKKYQVEWASYQESLDAKRKEREEARKALEDARAKIAQATDTAPAAEEDTITGDPPREVPQLTEARELYKKSSTIESARRLTVETDLYRVVFSELGARPVEWEIKSSQFVRNLAENGDREHTTSVRLIPQVGNTDERTWPLELVGYTARDFNDALFTEKIEKVEKGTRLTLTSDPVNDLVVVKQFLFRDDSYVVDFNVTFQNGTQTRKRLGREQGFGIGWEGGFGDPDVADRVHGMVSLVVASDNSIRSRRIGRDDAPYTLTNSAANIDWVGQEKKFFATLIVPSAENPIQSISAHFDKNNDDPVYQVKGANQPVSLDLFHPSSEIEPGASASLAYQLYVGPKNREALRGTNFNIAANVTPPVTLVFHTVPLGMSFLRPFCLVLLGLMKWLNSHLGAWGLAIIVTTIIVRTLIYPLTHWAIKNQARTMIEQQKIRPELEAINKKFKSDPMKRNQAMMQLYRDHNVNPLGALRGCFPVLLQMPVFMALYVVFEQSVELRGQSFLWIPDLSGPDRLIDWKTALPLIGTSFNILPLVMAATNFLQMKIMHMPAADETQEQVQKQMMIMMPIMFTFFLYHLPSGLILYWVVSNIISIGQSYLTKRIIAAHMAEHEAKSKSGGNPPAVARKDDEGKQQGAIART